MTRTFRTMLFILTTAMTLTAVVGSARAQCPPEPGLPASNWDCPSINIHDYSHTISNQPVDGLDPSIYDVDVFTQIQHQDCGELLITLKSPAGTVVVLSANHGGTDSFANTTWDDSSPHPVSTYVFSYGSAPDLRPDGALAAFQGENPNGVWTLDCQDQYFGNVGVVWCWNLMITTSSPGSSGVVNYCTSSITTHGCSPTMNASADSASITAGPGSFILSSTSIEGQKPGLIFYGISGRVAFPWSVGSSSFLCVKAPRQHMRAQDSGGTLDACDGLMSEDFFDYTMNFNPGALGNPITAGTVYDAQAWFRDPAAPKTTNLSNGLEFTLCP